MLYSNCGRTLKVYMMTPAHSTDVTIRVYMYNMTILFF